MRAPLLALLLLTACDDYGEVQRTDTIEAYETWLKENPGNGKAFQAEIRLEELYLEKARASKSLEDWDAYLKRWPQGRHVEAGRKEREEHLFAWAEWESTPEAFQRYLSEYTTGFADHRRAAKAAEKATAYARSMTFTDVRTRKVNLAEDPNGPLDGTEFALDVTNGGDQTLEAMWLRIHYLGPEGTSLGHREWPLVAPYKEYPVPVPDEWTLPMKPGDTRTWTWSTGDLPEAFSGKVRVVPIRVRFVE